MIEEISERELRFLSIIERKREIDHLKEDEAEVNDEAELKHPKERSVSKRDIKKAMHNIIKFI